VKGLIICVSFAAVFGVTYRLNQLYIREMAETIVVVTARVDLLPGEQLTPDMLLLAERPAFGLGNDYAADISILMEEGPWYTGEIGFGAGDILRPGRLAAADSVGEGEQWAFGRQDNARLIAVETNLVRSGGDWLQPGMLADAMVYIPGKDRYDDPLSAQVIGPDEDPLLGGLRIMAVKNKNGQTLGEQVTEDIYDRDLLPAIVTLLIDKQDVDRIKALVFYNEEGKIYFSPTTDKSVPEKTLLPDPPGIFPTDDNAASREKGVEDDEMEYEAGSLM